MEELNRSPRSLVKFQTMTCGISCWIHISEEAWKYMLLAVGEISDSL